MSSSLVYGSSRLADVSVEMVGGKAFGLMRLADKGLPVPAFYVLSAEAFRQTVGVAESDGCQQEPQQIAEVTRQRIEATVIAPPLARAIEAVHQACFSNNSLVAVRSSASTEDGASYSFAGMYESVLGIRGLENLLAAIKRVWMSAVSPQVIAYRQHHGLPPLDPSMAVIVQEMVDADCSGVCFTCDPMTGSRQRIFISSLWGLGEGLVSRGFPADSYRVDRDSFAIAADVAEKSERLTIDHDSGQLRRVDMSPGDRKVDSLTREQVVDVARAAIEIESMFGDPQDVEFCFGQDGCLNILQSRPVTRCSGPDDLDRQQDARQNHIVWDNSNIIESYSGVTTPMTFSFIRRAYSIVYHCFAEVMGISPQCRPAKPGHISTTCSAYFTGGCTTTSRTGIGSYACFRGTTTTGASWNR